MLTNTVNGKRYIGQTRQDDVNKRWDKYRYKTKNCIGQYLYNALVKYECNNFRFQIICICFDEDCNKYEIDYIQKYKTLVPNGYNIQSGGSSFSKPNPWSQEQRQNLSIKMSGINNPNFGKKASKETCERKSTTMKKLVRDGTFIPRYDILKNNTDQSKLKVAQYDKDMSLIKIHDSLHDAARYVGGQHFNISNCINNKPHYKTHKGFIWRVNP